MDMVFPAIKLHQFSFKVVTDTEKMPCRSPSTSLLKTSGLYFVTTALHKPVLVLTGTGDQSLEGGPQAR